MDCNSRKFKGLPQQQHNWIYTRILIEKRLIRRTTDGFEDIS